MGLDKEILGALRESFPNAAIEVHNESHLHAGHAGDDGSGESHWRVVVQFGGFSGMSRLARHRAVHAALGPDIIGRIHALALELSDHSAAT